MRTHTEPGTKFHYTEPAPLNTNILLLTHANKCVLGVWKGPALPARNPHFKAWFGLPGRDKVLERELEYL